jgi:hypothetical protein
LPPTTTTTVPPTTTFPTTTAPAPADDSSLLLGWWNGLGEKAVVAIHNDLQGLGAEAPGGGASPGVLAACQILNGNVQGIIQQAPPIPVPSLQAGWSAALQDWLAASASCIEESANGQGLSPTTLNEFTQAQTDWLPVLDAVNPLIGGQWPTS